MEIHKFPRSGFLYSDTFYRAYISIYFGSIRLLLNDCASLYFYAWPSACAFTFPKLFAYQCKRLPAGLLVSLLTVSLYSVISIFVASFIVKLFGRCNFMLTVINWTLLKS